MFAELNRGEEVTKGLRKVDKSEMTHKNPALRAGSVVPAGSGPGGSCLLLHYQNLYSRNTYSNKEAHETREACCVSGEEAFQVCARR